jgi:hypothetical protein
MARRRAERTKKRRDDRRQVQYPIIPVLKRQEIPRIWACFAYAPDRDPVFDSASARASLGRGPPRLRLSRRPWQRAGVVGKSAPAFS